MTMDAKMAWRNIWRNPRRSLLTIAAIAFACLVLVFMFSMQFGTYEAMINSSLMIHTGHLQVQAQGYREKQSMRRSIDHPQRIQAHLQDHPGVAAVAARANAFALVSSPRRTYGIMVTGIDPQREALVSTKAAMIRSGAYLDAKDRLSVLVGQLLADNLGVAPGDELTLLGQGHDGSIAATVVRVCGIFSSGMDQFDRNTVFMPLAGFQETFAMTGRVHEIVIRARALSQVSAIKADLVDLLSGSAPPSKRPLTVLDWNALMPGLLESIQLDLAMGVIMYIILIIVVAFSILNTFLMAIFERTREFGVLLSLGTAPGRLTKLVLTESMGLTAIGISGGIFLGSLVTLWYQHHGLDISKEVELLGQFGISGLIYPRLSLLSMTIGPLMVFFFTFLAALYPALRLRRLSPVAALGHV